MTTKKEIYSNKQTDFEVGKTYKIAKRGIHCFEPGTKVRVLNYYDAAVEDPNGRMAYMEGYDVKSKRMLNVHGPYIRSNGTKGSIDQWVDPDDLEKPKSSWRKELLRADGSVYLVRYTLLRLPFLRIRLHHILLSDTECCHDHPWNFISIILRGRYKEIRRFIPEEMPNEKETLKLLMKFTAMGVKYNEHTDKFTSEKWHGPGSVLVRKTTDIHRLELDFIDLGNGHTVPKPCWTLVIMGRYQRPSWGFWKGKKFVHNEAYEFAQKCDE